MVKRRIGLLGGTFDPIHFGHLLLAEEVRVALPLERVLFVPAGQPPHKLDEPHTEPAHRLRMLELAIADNPGFGISRVDIDRPGPHYSFDMVRLVQAELGAEVELFFLMGLDSLATILTWRMPERLLELCQLVVACRPGCDVDLKALVAALPALEWRALFISMPLMEIAGVDLRRRVRCGHSIRYQVPEAARQYVEQNRLYGAGPPGG